MPARFLPLLGVLVLAFPVGLPGQKNHNLNWKTGASPAAFKYQFRPKLKP
jgi:hypothetical protein